jgi:hypothetical protein
MQEQVGERERDREPWSIKTQQVKQDERYCVGLCQAGVHIETSVPGREKEGSSEASEFVADGSNSRRISGSLRPFLDGAAETRFRKATHVQ